MSSNHRWTTPEAIAAQLDARPMAGGWATCCPTHGGDNPRAFTIKRGEDRYGHPCTLLYCHTHHCDIRDICATLDITLASLFCVHPDYARQTRSQPRSGSRRIAALRKGQEPADQDDLAQLMLEEMVTSDPGFLAACAPARETCWRLLQDPARKAALVQTFIEAHMPVRATLDALRDEWGAHGHGTAS